jgi:glycosyltransferase involved in cell wall biosynthesis
MRLTAILCTYNRCQSLQRALNSAAALVLPESVEWEVLVVDNNSNDQTRKTVGGFSARYPGRFRYLFEPRPGKSHALNAGIREARGDVLAFMDDDVVVHPEWLQNLTAALQDREWAGSGGRILPEWNCSPPRWLSPDSSHAAGPLVAFHPMQEAGEISVAPIGTNMAFRKEMFEKYGNFRVDLGPRPGSELRNEDTEFGERLLAAGERLRYEPSAIVYHPVSENRLKKEYFLAWWLNKGEANIRQFGVRPGTKYRVAGIPLYLLRRFAKWTVKWMLSVDPVKRFSNRLHAWENVGEILECYRESTAPKKRTENCSA